MKDKIFSEALEWYEKQDKNFEVSIEDFVDVVITKTADSILKTIKDEFCAEFENGNLQHPFIISSEYYLDLKLKDVKLKCINSAEDFDDYEDKKENKEN